MHATAQTLIMITTITNGSRQGILKVQAVTTEGNISVFTAIFSSSLLWYGMHARLLGLRFIMSEVPDWPLTSSVNLGK